MHISVIVGEAETFSPSQTWGKQTSSFCWCQRYVWHTTLCLRKQHWKDQCVFCYLCLSDSTTRVVVRNCLVMMHRLCAVVCCHSTSISICTGKKQGCSEEHRGYGTATYRAITQCYHLSSFSKIMMALWWYLDTDTQFFFSEMMMTTTFIHISF